MGQLPLPEAANRDRLDADRAADVFVSVIASDKTIEHLDTFWELVDEILNAVLFVLIGLEVLVISLRGDYLFAGLLAIPLVLVVRLVSVGLPIGIMRHFRSFSPGAVSILIRHKPIPAVIGQQVSDMAPLNATWL